MEDRNDEIEHDETEHDEPEAIEDLDESEVQALLGNFEGLSSQPADFDPATEIWFSKFYKKDPEQFMDKVDAQIDRLYNQEFQTDAELEQAKAQVAYLEAMKAAFPERAEQVRQAEGKKKSTINTLSKPLRIQEIGKKSWH